MTRFSNLLPFIGALCAALFLISVSDQQDDEIDDARYCDMVSKFKATNGKRGWPDYNENYNELCVKAKR